MNLVVSESPQVKPAEYRSRSYYKRWSQNKIIVERAFNFVDFTIDFFYARFF